MQTASASVLSHLPTIVALLSILHSMAKMRRPVNSTITLSWPSLLSSSPLPSFSLSFLLSPVWFGRCSLSSCPTQLNFAKGTIRNFAGKNSPRRVPGMPWSQSWELWVGETEVQPQSAPKGTEHAPALHSYCLFLPRLRCSKIKKQRSLAEGLMYWRQYQN